MKYLTDTTWYEPHYTKYSRVLNSRWTAQVALLSDRHIFSLAALRPCQRICGSVTFMSSSTDTGARHKGATVDFWSAYIILQLIIKWICRKFIKKGEKPKPKTKIKHREQNMRKWRKIVCGIKSFWHTPLLLSPATTATPTLCHAHAHLSQLSACPFSCFSS